MNALRLLLVIVTCAWLVALRRLFKGARHPRWTYRYELIAEVARRQNERALGAPVERIRRALGGVPIHRSIVPALVHTRTELAGRPAELFQPKIWQEGDPTLLYLHGGGYIVCSPATHRDLISRIAVATGARTIAVDYRKAPEHPFPAPIDDCEAAYRALLQQGVVPETLFVAGDSAGGGLTLATLLRARGAGLALPRGAILLSPWADLEARSASIQANAHLDYLRPPALLSAAADYLQGGDPTHPEASPVHADLAGLPPLLVQTGSAELFFEENCQLVERARAAGLSVVHEIEEGMIHVWQAFASLTPEGRASIASIGRFVRGEPAPSVAVEVAIEARVAAAE
jgi:epsilon-lactone hydrolase